MSIAGLGRVSGVLGPNPATARTGCVRRCTLLATFVSMILLCTEIARANPAVSDRPACSISQITRFSDTGAGRPFISGLGTRIVFLSTANPTGNQSQQPAPVVPRLTRPRAPLGSSQRRVSTPDFRLRFRQ